MPIPPKAIFVLHKPVNTHSMQTRAKTGFSQSRHEPKLLLANSEPKIVTQTLDLQ